MDQKVDIWVLGLFLTLEKFFKWSVLKSSNGPLLKKIMRYVIINKQKVFFFLIFTFLLGRVTYRAVLNSL